MVSLLMELVARMFGSSAKAEGVIKADPPKPTIEVINVKVDETKTIAQLVAAGSYGRYCVSCDVTDEYFSLGAIPADKELVRVRFNHFLPSRNAVLAARAVIGLEPVISIGYLLTVGASKSHLLSRSEINDLDSGLVCADGHVGTPFLWSNGRQRMLLLRLQDDGFDGFEWFLALRDKRS